jgi:NTP pyrophosphatase (non-canonical NTP hydrolase)
MEKKMNEILNILTEECAEVIQAISKTQRFGMDNTNPFSAETNRDRLEQEIGDLLTMIDLLFVKGIINEENILKAQQRKIDKLKIWSKIYEE